MRYTPALQVPDVRVTHKCQHLGPVYSCNRPAGHTGRHAYMWRHAGPLSGTVRAVWT